MSIPTLYKGRYFFHFTHLDNLESICKNGLLCTNKKKELGIEHTNVASISIQERRSSMDVTCEPFGTVHDYVPFYWCTINPMMLALVNTKNVDQQHVIILAVSIDKILHPNTVFTSASANTAIAPEFYNDISHLDDLDWNAIDLAKWGSTDNDERHRRMAEVLFFEEVPFSYIDCIITWNDSYKNIVEDGCQKLVKKPPKVVSSIFNGNRFHFTKFMLGKPEFSLVTGPYWLKREFEKTVKKVINAKKDQKDDQNFAFESLTELLDSIEQNFCAIPELEGIYELETVNDVHSENVSDHTKKVVEKLLESDCYKTFEENDRQLLRLAAYLHDIGKGPRSKWKDGKQPAYPDHPVDALPMIKRILKHDVKQIPNSEVRLICLLVAYHDLIGEIFGKGRDKQQLFDIINHEKEFDMLSCINLADVSAINSSWSINFNLEIESLKIETLERIT